MVSEEKKIFIRNRLRKGGLTKEQITAFEESLPKDEEDLFTMLDKSRVKAATWKRFVYLAGTPEQIMPSQKDISIQGVFLTFRGINLEQATEHGSNIVEKAHEDAVCYWFANSEGTPEAQAIFAYER